MEWMDGADCITCQANTVDNKGMIGLRLEVRVKGHNAVGATSSEGSSSVSHHPTRRIIDIAGSLVMDAGQIIQLQLRAGADTIR